MIALLFSRKAVTKANIKVSSITSLRNLATKKKDIKKTPSSAPQGVTYDSISAAVKAASYAVRGPLVTKSMELGRQLREDPNSLPYKEIVSCNIGNPHALNQKSISFVREVLSLVINPSLMTKGKHLFAPDVIKRANRYLTPGIGLPDVGAYSESQGILAVREEVAKFLMERDGYLGDPNDIFLTNGASEGVRLCMQTLIRDPASGTKDGILTPIPQYPLYSALTTLLQGNLVPYYLTESKGWECSKDMLAKSLDQARADGISTRALVIINPGNPTGQILNESSMRDIVKFCIDEKIVLMADEVYQENIWREGAKFISFRKVAKDMDALW